MPAYRRPRRWNLVPWASGAFVVIALVFGTTWWFTSGKSNPSDDSAASRTTNTTPPTLPVASHQPTHSPPKDSSTAAKPTPQNTPAVQHDAKPSTPEPRVAAATASRDEEVLIPAGPHAPPAVADDAALPKPPTTTGAGDDTPPHTSADMPTGSSNTAIAAAAAKYSRGQAIEARHELNALLQRNLSESDAREVRTLLAKIAEDTVFSRNIRAGDPLVESYAVASGDVLVNIAKRFDVPAEALMKINSISNPRALRVGQQLKAPRGPFNVKISKSQFRLDLYLGDLYVRSYRVAIGAQGGTPEGVWQVKDRLQNPTYYPPASASDKRIVHADDPDNPLGEYWIGLEGIEGAAVGKEGFGIHGTNQPESIGQAVSLGCVRMRNEDVGEVFAFLQPGKSRVTILP